MERCPVAAARSGSEARPYAGKQLVIVRCCLNASSETRTHGCDWLDSPAAAEIVDRPSSGSLTAQNRGKLLPVDLNGLTDRSCGSICGLLDLCWEENRGESSIDAFVSLH